MGSVWPEPVYVNPPCCPKLSYDEMMVLDLLTAAVRSDRQAFDDFLRDMLPPARSEEHTSELQSLMRISYAVFCLKKKTHIIYVDLSEISVTHQTSITTHRCHHLQPRRILDKENT